MGANTEQAELEAMVRELEGIAARARETFGRLSARQLNWKPAPDRWSVGQCFDHLITTNRCFFPDMERVASGERKSSLWERVSPLSGLFGRLVLRGLDPEKGMKVKAPAVFMPASSDVDPRVVERFAAHQTELTEKMRATAGRPLARTVVTSPVSALATYSLLDA